MGRFNFQKSLYIILIIVATLALVFQFHPHIIIDINYIFEDSPKIGQVWQMDDESVEYIVIVFDEVADSVEVSTYLATHYAYYNKIKLETVNISKSNFVYFFSQVDSLEFDVERYKEDMKLRFQNNNQENLIEI